MIENPANRLEWHLHREPSVDWPDLHSEFEKLRAQLRTMERRLVRLMFILWIAQNVILVAVLFAFFRS